MARNGHQKTRSGVLGNSSLAGWRIAVDLCGQLRKVDGVAGYVSQTSVDCGNAYQLSKRWSTVLGYVHDPRRSTIPATRSA